MFKNLRVVLIVFLISLNAYSRDNSIVIPSYSLIFIDENGAELKDIKVEVRLSSYKKYFTLNCPSNHSIGVDLSVGCHKSKTFSFGQKEVFEYLSNTRGIVEVPEIHTKYKYQGPTLDIRAFSNRQGFKLVMENDHSKRCEIWIRGEREINQLPREINCALVKIETPKSTTSSWSNFWDSFNFSGIP